VLKKSSEISKTKASSINLIFNYGSGFIQIINNIILVPFYLKFFTLSDYGAWIASAAIVNIFMILDPGISSISAQKLSKSFTENSDRDFQSIFNSSLFLSIIFSVLILFVGFFIVFFIPGIINYENVDRLGELSTGLSVYIVSISIVPIFSVLSSMLQSLLRTFPDNTINLLSLISSPFVIVFSLLNGLGLMSFALGVLIPNIIRLVGTLVLVVFYWTKYLEVRIFKPGSINIFPIVKDIKFLYLRKISSSIEANIETAIAGIFFTTEITAAISIIKRLFLAVGMFSMGIATSTYTSLAHVFSSQNLPNLNLVLKKTVHSFQLIHFLGTVLILASIEPIVYLWLERELFFSYFFVLLIAFNTFLSSSVTLYSSTLYSSGDFRSVAYISVVETLIRVSFTLLLIQFLDYYGLPLAGIIATFISIYLLYRSIIHKTKQNIRDLIFPTSSYEVSIYILAIVVGYFHIHSSTTIKLFEQILLTCFVIVCLMAFSRKVRNLIKELTSSLVKREP